MSTIALRGFRPTHTADAITRVARSSLPKSIKRWLLMGLFAAGLAGTISMELRTSAGADHQARVMFDTASTGTGSYAASNYIALTENATAPASGDTTLTAELTGFGLQRQQATYAHTNGTTTVTLTKTFTSSDATTRVIAKGASFNASSTGTMSFETLVSPTATLISGDSVAITWTFTL